MKTQQVIRLAALALLLVPAFDRVFGTGTAYAQETAALAGVVRDAAGEPLSQVQIVVAELRREERSDAEGAFRIRGLHPGVYHLDASLIGYAPSYVAVEIGREEREVTVEIRLTPSPLALPGVNVTALPAGADALRVAQATTDLSGRALDRSLATGIAQTLQNEPGMAVRYQGPAVTLPVIRGLTGERILVLRDGQRAADMASTSTDHALTVDPLAATRLEVVRGPASLLHGSSALGGVVNVISNDIPTSIPAQAMGRFTLQGESVSPGGAALGDVRLPLGEPLALSVRVGARQIGDVHTGDGGSLENSDGRTYHGSIGLGYNRDGISAGAAYRPYAFEYGVPAAPDAHEAGIRIRGRRHGSSANVDLVLPYRHFSALRLDGTAQWYSHDEIEGSGEVGTTFDLRTQTLKLQATTRVGRLRGALGASGIFKQYAPSGEEALTPPTNSVNPGIFIFQELPIGSAERGPVLQAGLRFDLYRINAERDDEFGPARSREFGSVSGSVGWSVPFGDGVSLGVSVARAYRAPTVEELFSNAFHAALGSFDVGTPDLQPELNHGVDGVLRVHTDRLSGQLAGYYSRISNFITPTISGDTTIVDEDGQTDTVPLIVFDQENATLRGIEGSIEVLLARHFVFGALGDLVRGRFTNGEVLPFMRRRGSAARYGGMTAATRLVPKSVMASPNAVCPKTNTRPTRTRSWGWAAAFTSSKTVGATPSRSKPKTCSMWPTGTPPAGSRSSLRTRGAMWPFCTGYRSEPIGICWFRDVADAWPASHPGGRAKSRFRPVQQHRHRHSSWIAS